MQNPFGYKTSTEGPATVSNSLPFIINNINSVEKVAVTVTWPYDTPFSARARKELCVNSCTGCYNVATCCVDLEQVNIPDPDAFKKSQATIGHSSTTMFKAS